MASLARDPGGTFRIQVAGPDGKRRAIRLGKIPKKDADAIRGLVERLNTAALTGSAPADGDALRVADLPDLLHAKLAKVKLAKPRQKTDAATLGPFLAAYLADRADAKPNTRRHLKDAAGHLLTFFGSGKPLAEVTPGDADDFRRFLAKGGDRGPRKPGTVNRWMGRAGQFFRHAERKGLIQRNPFSGQSVAVRSDRSRLVFVSRDDAARVLDACPDAEWRLIFALARWGGLRCPSELAPLTWGDVHWPVPSADDPRDRAGWLRVTSPKTEHHAGGDHRVIPLFPELLPHLAAMFDAAEPGTVAVLPRFQRPAGANPYNPHTHMKRIVRKAGVREWPKLFQNLRSTRQTELAATHPAHVVCEWMGNSRDVAREHYLQMTDADFARAVAPAGDGRSEGGAESGARAAQNPARRVPASRGKEPHGERENPTIVSPSPLTAGARRYTPANILPPVGAKHTN